MEIKVLDIKKNSVYAIKPMESEKYHAGLDFFSAYEYKIKPNGKKMIDTEIKIQIPVDMCGALEGNKTYSYENHCTIIGGTIDEKFKDTVKFALFNHGSKRLVVPHGQLIGHLIVLGEVIYPVVRNAGDPEPDDDVDTEKCCDGLSNKFEKIEIDINKEDPGRTLKFLRTFNFSIPFP
jgi:dUTPase